MWQVTSADPRSPAVGRAGRRSFAAARPLVLVAIVLMALNLRPAVSSVGVSLEQLRNDLGMSGSVAGVLTTLPVLCFAAFGLATKAVAGRLGLHKTALGALALLLLGLTVRALTSSTAIFLLASVVALAGIAVANVSLPPLVKLHFPDRIGVVTGLYTAMLMTGAFLPSVVVVPLDDATGSWRAGLLAWAVVAGLGLLPWLLLAGQDVRTSPVPGGGVISVRMLTRSRLAWCMAAFCGLQSAMAYAQFGWLPQVYSDAGASREQASLMLGLLTIVGVPVTLLLPWLIRRVGDQRRLIATFVALAAVGFLGLWRDPMTAPWLWALLLGAGGSAFPYVLTMIGLRSRTPEGTAALSGFVQSVGYLIAAVGPLGTGLLFDLTGSWDVPLLALAGLSVPMLLAGLGFARPQYVEDTIARPSAESHH